MRKAEIEIEKLASENRALKETKEQNEKIIHHQKNKEASQNDQIRQLRKSLSRLEKEAEDKESSVYKTNSIIFLIDISTISLLPVFSRLVKKKKC